MNVGRIEAVENNESPSFEIEIDDKTKVNFNNLFSDDFSEIEDSKPEHQIDDSERLKHSAEVLADIFSDDYDISNENTLEEQDYKEDGNENSDTVEDGTETFDVNSVHEPNSTYEVNGVTYETDDNGVVYKINGMELMPNCEYEINGMKYTTDDKGRIISCEATPKSTPEGERDQKAQKDAGGEDRHEKDQGSHIIARIFGGSKGLENMLALRSIINQGPYKAMESEIADALAEGKDVHISVSVEYEGNSKRPSKVTVTYTIDGKETTVEFDNDENSTDLLDSLEDKIDENSYKDLVDEINDAKAEGKEISIISVKTEYDEEGNITKVTVVTREEGEGGSGNEKRVFLPKEADV